MEREILLPWSVWRGGKKDLFPDDESTEGRPVEVSVSPRAGMSSEFQKLAFASRKKDPRWVSKLRDIFEFRTIPHPSPRGNKTTRFGYIRIRKFKHRSRTEFVEEFLRILEVMNAEAPTGLILDVRGNPGGIIRIGESILQFLTPRKITPEQFQFIHTPAIEELCSEPKTDPAKDDTPTMIARPQREILARDWGKLLGGTGSGFSRSAPLTTFEDANQYGQRYWGHSVLIIDGLCYSTTDIFSAGFQDHEIGLVLGADEATGAGGANVWKQSKLAEMLVEGFAPIEDGTTMRVSIRRSFRVGPQRGNLLEEFGVQPAKIHRITRRDLLDGNQDLIRHAAKLLATAGPCVSLRASVEEVGNHLLVHFESQGLARLEFHVDGRPHSSISAPDKLKDTHRLEPDRSPGGREAVRTVELKGYARGPQGKWQLRAARKVSNSEPDAWTVRQR
ncbi:MAG: hypothetical protein GY953_22160 [bacterium]|nr:hypothetical protein [bacterium]